MKSKIPTNPQSDALRILILEDVPADAELVERELRKAGLKFMSRWVDKKDDFLSQLEEFSPDIVLSDYSMSQFNGMEALGLVKERFPSIPLIIVTGSLNEETAVKCMKAGAVDYVLKENMARLGQAVVRVLENKRIREEKGRSEEALRESEEKYRTILESIEDGYFEVDLAGNLTFFNDSMCKILGYSRDEFMGVGNREYMSPETAKRVYKIFNKVYKTGESVKRVEWESIRKDGSKIYTESSVSLMKDSKGQPIGFQGIARDITERKQIEDALREREGQVRLLLESTAEAIYGLDMDGNCTFANRSCLKLLGYSTADELIGKNMHILIHHTRPDSLPYPVEQCYICKAFTKGEGVHVDDEVLWRADGTSFPAEYWAYPVYRDGQLLGAVTTFLDITEHKDAEEALHNSEERYRTLFEESKDAIYIVRREGEFIDVNQTMTELFGYTKEEMIKINIKEIYSNPDDRPGILEELDKKGVLKNYEIKFKKKNGKEIDCLMTVTTKKDYDKNIIGYQGIIRDITEYKKLEAQLIQSQKMEAIGRLAGGIAHDFNNLLTAIIGYADLMLMSLGKQDPLQEGAMEIRKAAGRASTLTRRLLDFSRNQMIHPAVMDINYVLGEMNKILRRLIGEDIELTTLLEPELWKVKVDAGQMDQVIMNLAVNARDAMPQGGKFILETSNVYLDKMYAHQHGVEMESGEYVMLEASDTGKGIKKDIQPLIFDPFFTTKEKGTGTGLGLSTVYGIVKQSGGYIWVYSEPGKGTSFKIYLPRAAKEADEVKKEKVHRKELHGSETILLVEDNESVLNLARDVLKKYGYRVLAARDGEEALRASDQHEGPIHLLLTDVVMPKMNGRELAERLGNKIKDMKVLYMSGYTNNAIVHLGVIEHGVEFIQKPFTPKALARKVRNVLDN